MKAMTTSMSEHISNEKSVLVKRFSIILQEPAMQKYTKKSVQGSKNIQIKVYTMKGTAISYSKDNGHQKKKKKSNSSKLLHSSHSRSANNR